jgi:predicted PurR-regulated permease PerM
MPGLKNRFSRELIETILVILLFIGLLFALYRVLEVFIGVLTFALIFAVSFNGPYHSLVKLLRGRRKLSGIIYSVVLVSIIALPLIFLIAAMSRHLKELAPWLANVKANGLPPLPANISNLPLLGPYISSFWADFRQSPKAVLSGHQHQLNVILHHIITGGLGVLGVALQLILGIIISAFLLERGNILLRPFKEAIKHLLTDEDGENLLEAITQAIRGVSIGVMGTAFIVAFISWTGLLLAGIPFATGIAALIFFLVVIQAGALVVWIPVIIWEALQGNHTALIILAIYLVIILFAELVIRPILIAKSGKLPFLVLFIGVIGGLAAWGFTGMFKGAIVTSVFYTIFSSWLKQKKLPPEQIIDPEG